MFELVELSLYIFFKFWVNKVAVIMASFNSLSLFDSPFYRSFGDIHWFVLNSFSFTIWDYSLLCSSEAMSLLISSITWIKFRVKSEQSNSLILISKFSFYCFSMFALKHDIILLLPPLLPINVLLLVPHLISSSSFSFLIFSFSCSFFFFLSLCCFILTFYSSFSKWSRSTRAFLLRCNSHLTALGVLSLIPFFSSTILTLSHNQ